MLCDEDLCRCLVGLVEWSADNLYLDIGRHQVHVGLPRKTGTAVDSLLVDKFLVGILLVDSLLVGTLLVGTLLVGTLLAGTLLAENPVVGSGRFLHIFLVPGSLDFVAHTWRPRMSLVVADNPDFVVHSYCPRMSLVESIRRSQRHICPVLHTLLLARRLGLARRTSNRLARHIGTPWLERSEAFAKR
jgi:hypothetical protein